MKLYCRIPIPVGGALHPELVRWLMWAARTTGMDLDLHQTNAGIATNRNQICEEFLRTNCSHLWMIDADVVCPLRLLTGDHAVLSGAYHHLICHPGQPPGLVWSGWTADAGGYTPLLSLPDRPVTVDAVGAGCLRISRSTLEAISPPWFEDRFHEGSFALQLGEDFDFCEKVRGVGERIWLEPRYRCHHMKALSMLVMDQAAKTSLMARLGHKQQETKSDGTQTERLAAG